MPGGDKVQASVSGCNLGTLRSYPVLGSGSQPNGGDVSWGRSQGTPQRPQDHPDMIKLTVLCKGSRAPREQTGFSLRTGMEGAG